MWDPEEFERKKIDSSIDGKNLPWKEKRIWEFLVFKQKSGFIQDLRILGGNEFFTFRDSSGNMVFARGDRNETKSWKAFKQEWKNSGPSNLEIYRDHRRGVFLAQIIKPEPKLGEIQWKGQADLY